MNAVLEAAMSDTLEATRRGAPAALFLPLLVLGLACWAGCGRSEVKPAACTDMDPETECPDDLPDATDEGGATAGDGYCVDDVDCEDGDPCTEDSCTLDRCTHTAIDCDDGLECTPEGCKEEDSTDGSEGSDGIDATDGADGTCVEGDCQCSDDDDCQAADGAPCKATKCDQGVCVLVGSEVPCDDSDECTENDACSEGSCTGSPMKCDAGKTCVGGSCADACELAGCECSDDVDCDSLAGACKIGRCVEGQCEVVDLAEGECDDGNPCTEGDVCKPDGCVGVKKDCDDGLPCSTDSCQSGTCVHSPCDCQSDEDCILSDAGPCKVGECVAGDCKVSLVSGTCDDGNPCTAGDACKSGLCSGSAMDCDDGWACSPDDCEGGQCFSDKSMCDCENDADCGAASECEEHSCALGSCVANAKSGECEDDDPCTGTGHCEAGDCKVSDIECDDKVPCTLDYCEEGACKVDAASCVPCAGAEECDDGNECTVDSCSDDYCNHAEVSCDDGNPCTSGDHCVPGGCAGVPVPAFTACDGVAGTESTCLSAECVAASSAAYTLQLATTFCDAKILGVTAGKWTSAGLAIAVNFEWGKSVSSCDIEQTDVLVLSPGAAGALAVSPAQGTLRDIAGRLAVGSKSNTGLFGEVPVGLLTAPLSDDWPQASFTPSYPAPAWSDVSAVTDDAGVEYHLLAGPFNSVGKGGPHVCAYEDDLSWSCDDVDATYAAGDAATLDFFAASLAPIPTSQRGWLLSRKKGGAGPAQAWSLDLLESPAMVSKHSLAGTLRGLIHSASDQAWAYGDSTLVSLDSQGAQPVTAVPQHASRTYLDAEMPGGVLVFLTSRGTTSKTFELVSLVDPSEPDVSGSWSTTGLPSTQRLYDSIVTGPKEELFVLGRATNGSSLHVLHFADPGP